MLVFVWEWGTFGLRSLENRAAEPDSLDMNTGLPDSYEGRFLRGLRNMSLKIETKYAWSFSSPM
jgi:hypothetical protein